MKRSVGWMTHLGLLFVVFGLIGIVAPTPARALSTYRMAWYYSDDTFSTQIGERSALCTSTYNWGSTSAYVFRESGSCLVEGGSSQPEWSCWCDNGGGPVNCYQELWCPHYSGW